MINKVNRVWEGFTAETVRHLADVYGGKTLLITGARGYLGAVLTQALTALECSLILLDRSPEADWRPAAARAQVTFQKGDVSLRETWQTALEGVDIVFHLAGLEYRHREDFDPRRDLEVTLFSVRHLLDVISQRRLTPKIIYSSSANLFGRAPNQPVNEGVPDDPLTLWAVHKLMAEHSFRIAALESEVRSFILRFANIFGPTSRADRMSSVVLNRIISTALSLQPLFLYANRDCLRDFLYIDDAVRALLLAGAADEKIFTGDYYVIGSGAHFTLAEIWTQIAQQVENCTGHAVPVRFDESVKVGPSEIRNFVADATRFRQATGWTPQVELPRGIELTINALTQVKGGFDTPRSVQLGQLN